MIKRFEKNYSTINSHQQECLKKARVLVVGLGGLGGIVSEGLIRLGLYTIGICDFDTFDETNLNRQLLSNEENMGKPKLEACKEKLLKIHSAIEIIRYGKLTEENTDFMQDLASYHVVIDCLDNYESRELLHTLCKERKIPLVYGAIAGDYGYVGVVSRENSLLFNRKEGIEKKLGNPFYTPAIIGSLQIKLVLDILFSKQYLKKGFYHIDLGTFTIEKICLT